MKNDPLGKSLGATHAAHIRLIEKPIVDFLLNFFARYYVGSTTSGHR